MSDLLNGTIDCKIAVSKWNKKNKSYYERLIVIRSDSGLLENFVINAKRFVETRTRKDGYYIRIHYEFSTDDRYFYINSKTPNAVKSFLDLLTKSVDIPLFDDACLNGEMEAPMFPLNRQGLIKRFTDYHAKCLKNQKPKLKSCTGAKLLNSADASGIVESYHALSKGFCDIFAYCYEEGIINELDDLDDLDNMEDDYSVEQHQFLLRANNIGT